MIARLVEHEHVGAAQQEPRQAEPGTLAPGEHTDRLAQCGLAEEHRGCEIEDLLMLGRRRCCPLEVLKHRLPLIEAGVDVLSVGAHLTAMAPLHVASEWIERSHKRAEEGRFSLAVVAHDRGAAAVHDLKRHLAGHGVVGIADRQVAAADSSAATGSHFRAANRGRWRIEGDLLKLLLKLGQLFCLRLRLRGCRGPSTVAGNKILEVAFLRQDRGVGAFGRQLPFPLMHEVVVDGARMQRQLAVGQVEGLIAGGCQKRPVVGDHQAGLAIAPEKMLQQDLRPQIEEVGRLVEQQEVWLMQQEGRQLHPRLPAAGELLDRPGEHRAFDLKVASHLATLPVGLATVADQKVEGRLTRLKRIVLPQVAQPQPRMANDLPRVELLFAEDHPQQGALARSVAADEAHASVVGDRGRGLFEQHLIRVAFAGVFDLEQDGHTSRHRGKRRNSAESLAAAEPSRQRA